MLVALALGALLALGMTGTFGDSANASHGYEVVTTTTTTTTTTATAPVTPPNQVTAAFRRSPLRRALSRGVAVRFSCSAACAVKGRLTLSRRVRRRFRLPATVARGQSSLGAAGEKTFRMRFTRKARKRLRRARSVRFTAIVSSPTADTVRATLTLRR